jgi:PPP family 3-phenylpropionic acid transporter
VSVDLALALVWFFALGAVGIHMPLYGMYLEQNQSLSGAQVGLVLACFPLVGMLAQPLFGQLADRSGSRARVLALIIVLTAIGYAAVGALDGFAPLLAGTALLACAQTALIPSCTAVTLELRGSRAFSRLRAFGTLGFGVFLVAFQPLLMAYQHWRGLEAIPGATSQPGLGLIFGAAAACSTAAALCALVLPRGAAPERAQRGDWRALWQLPAFPRAIALGLLAYLFLQGPLVMLPNLVAARGGSAREVSWIWLAMLSLEVPLLLAAGAGIARFGVRGLLAIGLFAGGLRWALCGASGDLFLLYATAPLHGVCVAGLQVGLSLHIEACVPERLRSTAQNAVAAFGLGLGGMLSSLATGGLWESIGSAAPYAIGGIGALALAVAVPLFVPQPRLTGSR